MQCTFAMRAWWTSSSEHILLAAQQGKGQGELQNCRPFPKTLTEHFRKGKKASGGGGWCRHDPWCAGKCCSVINPVVSVSTQPAASMLSQQFLLFLFFISCVSNFGCTIKVSLLLQPVMVQQEMKDSRKQEVAEAKWMHDFWCQGHDQDILCHVHKEIGHRFAEADIQMYAHCSVPKHSSADMATCETAWAVIHCKYR